MNILIIQEKGRHEGNYQFREALNLKRAFDKLDINCDVWGLNYENFNIPFDQVVKGKDVILLLENYETNGWIPNLKQYNQLKIFWSIDSHCIPKLHQETCTKNGIDLVLCAIDHHQHLFNKYHQTSYFPNAYPDDLIFPLDNTTKSVDVGFCGNVHNRQQYIDLIAKNFNFKLDVFVIGMDMVTAINNYKIHFNRNIADDINFRTFETLGCKTLLLTNYTKGLEKLFDTEKHLVVYKNKRDLIDKIKYYLLHQQDADAIALEGYNHVKKFHSYFARAIELKNLIETYHL